MTEAGHQAKPDFFERLIDRALGVDGEIVPRLRSLFEPAPQTAMAPDWQEETSAPPVMAEDARDDLPFSQSRRSAEAGGETKHGIESTAPLEAASARATIAGPLARAPLAAADDGVPSAAALPSPARLDAAPRAADHAVSASAPPAEGALVSLSRPPARRRSAPAPAHVPPRAVAADEAARARLVPNGGIAVERIFVTPPGASRQRDDRPHNDLQESAVPTVNITIGRVEVRAVSAPAPKQRAEPRGSQPLGLDDYLKRRSAR
jgi:hypothetical protein